MRQGLMRQGLMPPSRTLPALVQRPFYLATGLWPLVHMRSFLRVTGPKRDLWLVKTVGGLIAVIGGAVVGGAVVGGGLRGRVSSQLRLAALGSAAWLGAVDVVYVSQRSIPKVTYAVAKAPPIALWGAAGNAARRQGAARRGTNPAGAPAYP